MNDLDTLRQAWDEPAPPSAEAHRSARSALLRAIETPAAPASAARRRARWGWLAAGSLATAAAAVVAIAAIAPSGGSPDDAPVDQTGRQLLLAAGQVALTEPLTTGTYWHTKTLYTDADGVAHPGEWWSPHNGDVYALSGPGVVLVTWGEAFRVGGQRLTVEQLADLPTEAAALRQWLADSYANPSPPVMPPGFTVEPPVAEPDPVPTDHTFSISTELVRLLWQVPIPPEVRAAAYAALAESPNVTNLGATDGTWLLRLEFPLPAADKYPGGVLPVGVNEWTVAIDPATSRLLSTTGYDGTTEILLTQWTDDRPEVIE